MFGQSFESDFFHPKFRLCLEMSLTVFCHELVFLSSTPFHDYVWQLVFLSLNSASENIVPELGTSSKTAGGFQREAAERDGPMPRRRASPAERRLRLLTLLLRWHPPCLSRLSLRLRSNKWQQLIKHMLSITYSRARAQRHSHSPLWDYWQPSVRFPPTCL